MTCVRLEAVKSSTVKLVKMDIDVNASKMKLLRYKYANPYIGKLYIYFDNRRFGVRERCQSMHINNKMYAMFNLHHALEKRTGGRFRDLCEIC